MKINWLLSLAAILLGLAPRANAVVFHHGFSLSKGEKIKGTRAMVIAIHEDNSLPFGGSLTVWPERVGGMHKGKVRVTVSVDTTASEAGPLTLAIDSVDFQIGEDSVFFSLPPLAPGDLLVIESHLSDFKPRKIKGQGQFKLRADIEPLTEPPVNATITYQRVHPECGGTVSTRHHLEISARWECDDPRCTSEGWSIMACLLDEEGAKMTSGCRGQLILPTTSPSLLLQPHRGLDNRSVPGLSAGFVLFWEDGILKPLPGVPDVRVLCKHHWR